MSTLQERLTDAPLRSIFTDSDGDQWIKEAGVWTSANDKFGFTLTTKSLANDYPNGVLNDAPEPGISKEELLAFLVERNITNGHLMDAFVERFGLKPVKYEAVITIRVPTDEPLTDAYAVLGELLDTDHSVEGIIQHMTSFNVVEVSE